MSPPLLSVVIPVRNRERYLRGAIDSLFEGGLTPDELEIIVVDDGSTDRTIATIPKSVSQIVRLPTSRGVAHARNRGVAVSRGRYLSFLDSDDILAKGSLRPRCDWLEKNPHSAAAAGRIGKILDARGIPLGDARDLLYSDLDLVHSTQPRAVDYAVWLRAGRPFFPTWCTVFRRDAFLQVGSFDETIEMVVEREFAYRFLRQFTIDLLPMEAVHYRWHEENLSLAPPPSLSGPYRDRAKSVAERFLVDAANEGQGR